MNASNSLTLNIVSSTVADGLRKMKAVSEGKAMFPPSYPLNRFKTDLGYMQFQKGT